MIDCVKCGARKDGARVPLGWKRCGDGVFCAKCWQALYVLRAITIPVVGPVGHSWPEFRVEMREAWADATALSNWLLTEMYVRDVRRAPGVEKLPKQPKTYLYPEAREKFPDVPSQTIAAMAQAMAGKYRAARYKLLWTGEVSLPTYRYPAPFVVPNQGWRAEYGHDNVPLVSLRLAGERWTLRLRGGHSFRRQLAAFAQIVSSEAVQGELAIYRQRDNSGDHRNGTTEPDANGGRAHWRIMCKMVAWLPRQPTREGTGTFFVRTDSDSLMIGLNAKDERLWVYNGDQVRRWTAEHARRLNRWADDAKAENRPPDFGSRREVAALKYRQRMDSITHELAAHVADYASRRRFARVQYDDSDKRFCGRFPWSRLSALIAQKCDAAGIEFVANAAVAEKPPGPLAESEVED